MFLKEFEFTLKSFLADFKFHHSNSKKGSRTSAKMGEQFQLQTRI